MQSLFHRSLCSKSLREIYELVEHQLHFTGLTSCQKTCSITFHLSLNGRHQRISSRRRFPHFHHFDLVLITTCSSTLLSERESESLKIDVSHGQRRDECFTKILWWQKFLFLSHWKNCSTLGHLYFPTEIMFSNLWQCCLAQHRK